MLQRELAKKLKVKVESSTVRRALRTNGYKWMHRIKKTKYSKEACIKRATFCDKLLEMTPQEQERKINFYMDGVVLVRPPSDPTARVNHVRSDEIYCWRKPSERDLPDCHGHNKYKKQAPKARILPLWGGVGPGGFATVCFHPDRKTNSADWARAVEQGALTKALLKVNPGRKKGPWLIICDNESFLFAPESAAAHKEAMVKFLRIPARSPDLNPVERFWSWLRRKLTRMDLDDLAKKRPVPGPTAFKERVRRVLQSPEAQKVAQNIFRSLRKTALDVKDRGGKASSRG
jgi:hypothetical protein